jgi:hypothetical protein
MPADLAEWQAEKGTDCPRPGVAMEPDNVLPLELVVLSLNEEARHLVEGTLQDEVPKGQRATVRRRVAQALGSEAIRVWRETAREEAEAKARAKART